MYIMDEKWISEHGALYSTDTTQHVRFWLRKGEQIPDASGSYTIKLSDLTPATVYYARSWVATSRKPYYFSVWNESERTIKFETLPE